MQERKEYYTTKEVAELLQIDVQTVRRYIREGKLKATRISKNIQRIAAEEIDFLFGKKDETND